MRNFCIIMLAMLASCAPVRYVSVPEVRTEYRDRETVKIDSVVLRDSVVTVIKGDTVTRETVRWRDRLRVMRDTVTVMRSDTVTVVQEVEVERRESLTEKIGRWASSLVVSAVALTVIYLIIRRKT